MPASLQSMFDPLSKSASVKSVFGEAIAANGKTIIPVARIAYGFGGGSGVYAVPIGVVEVTDSQTRFIPLNEKRKLVGAALVGFCLGAFWARRR